MYPFRLTATYLLQPINSCIITHMKKGRMFADGGARGNPGPAGSGVVIFEMDGDELGEMVADFGEFIGFATNNQAEYHAIVIGLRKAKELGFDALDVRLDSELAVKQLNGIYRVKNPELAKKVLQIHELRPAFRSLTFTHVRREQNTLADRAVNRVIDAALNV